MLSALIYHFTWGSERRRHNGQKDSWPVKKKNLEINCLNYVSYWQFQKKARHSWPLYDHQPVDCNGTRTHNHLVRKRTLNHLAKLFKPCCSHLNFRYSACFEQGFLDIQASIECEFTVECVRDMIRTYSQFFYSLSIF